MTGKKQEKNKTASVAGVKKGMASKRTATRASAVTGNAPLEQEKNSTLGRKPKRHTYSNRPDLVSMSIRLHPDQDEIVRRLAIQEVRSRNAIILVIVDWYLKGVDAGSFTAPIVKVRDESAIHKQPAFQFRASQEVVERLSTLAKEYGYRKMNPFIVAVVDQYLHEHSKEAG